MSHCQHCGTDHGSFDLCRSVDPYAEIDRLNGELEEVKKLLSLSDELRVALIQATRDLARDMSNMCDQMIEWKAVITAARTFVDEPNRVNNFFALDEAVAGLSRPA